MSGKWSMCGSIEVVVFVFFDMTRGRRLFLGVVYIRRGCKIIANE